MVLGSLTGSAAVRIAAAGLMAVLAGLTGCSGGLALRAGAPTDRIAGDPAAAVRDVANVLAGTGTSRARTSIETANGGTGITIRGGGEFDYARRRGRFEVTAPKGAWGAGRAGGPKTALVVPGFVYLMNWGLGEPKGKWLRVPTASLPEGNLVYSGATDPITAAELLRGARDVRLVGTRTLRGVAVRQYHGSVDLQRAADRADAAGARALRAAQSCTVSRVPFDAYLDERGRLRKVEQEFTFRGAGGSPGSAHSRVRVRSVTELYDFGTVTDISVPRPSDIYAGKIVSPGATGAARP